MAYSVRPGQVRRLNTDFGGGYENAGGGAALGAADWAGMGLQVGGAALSDWQAQKQREEEMRREDEALRMAAAEKGKNRAFDEKHSAEQLALSKRGMNQSGLDYLTGLVGSNQAAGRSRSFRDALLSRAGY